MQNPGNCKNNKNTCPKLGDQKIRGKKIPVNINWAIINQSRTFEMQKEKAMGSSQGWGRK